MVMVTMGITVYIPSFFLLEYPYPLSPKTSDLQVGTTAFFMAPEAVFERGRGPPDFPGPPQGCSKKSLWNDGNCKVE